MTRVAILISGRGSNMEALLRESRDGILAGVCEPVVVVSNRPDARGLEVAKGFGVATAVVPSAGLDREAYDRVLVEALEPYAVDWVVLAGFMRLLGPRMLRRYPGRITNIHPADPARFRGVGGYRWAWEQGLLRTTVTVHLVDEGVDTGPILAQEDVDLRGARSLQEVESRGLQVEHRLYSRVLRRLFLQGQGA